MRSIRIRVYALALLAVPAIAGPLAGQAAEEEFRWEGALAAGKTLQIIGINGGVVATPAPGGSAEVVAVKRAEDSDPAEVRIEVVERDDGVTICAVYPGQDGDDGNPCRGHGDTEDSDVVVEFDVRVPAGVHLVARTVNGGIDASGLSGDVRAETVNGGVEVSGSGVVEARTVNGAIEASMGAGSWTGELAFQTVNGSITVRLPAGAGATIEANTVNGSLSSDFPLTIAAEEQWGPKRMTGTIGAGGGSIDLETVNGSIEIRRG